MILSDAVCTERKVVARRIWSSIFCMAHRPDLPGKNNKKRAILSFEKLVFTKIDTVPVTLDK